MAKFKYTALAADGSTVTGTEEAFTLNQVNLALIERDLKPVEVSQKRDILHFEITKKKVPRKELMHFSRQMAVFIRAGIPVLDGLSAISEEMANKTFKKALIEMLEALREGQTFSEAASVQTHVFPIFYLSILQSAELTGNLDTVLDRLSDYIERDVEARQKIVSALVYPAVVMVMSVVTVVVLTTFVLPRFRDFFDSFDAELPLATRILIEISDFLSTFWFVFAGLGIASVVGVVVCLRTQRGRDFRDALLLKLPALGDLLEHAILERFCRVLSSMTRAGVPLPEAMAVVTQAANNAVYRKGLTNAREAMLRGEGLAKPLAETGLFPASARQMFKVGEETGTLDEQLETAAGYFDRELDYKIKRFTSLFEPAVIIFMGVIVGFVAIALVSAMYGIFDDVNAT